jgi:hypothetical protein
MQMYFPRKVRDNMLYAGLMKREFFLLQKVGAYINKRNKVHPQTFTEKTLDILGIAQHNPRARCPITGRRFHPSRRRLTARRDEARRPPQVAEA